MLQYNTASYGIRGSSPDINFILGEGQAAGFSEWVVVFSFNYRNALIDYAL
jgi:hypothetical protein